MRFKVVDGHERLAAHQRQPLGCGQPHQNAPDKAGTGGSRDARKIGKLHVCEGQSAGNDGVEVVHMGTRRYLWHHATVAGVLCDL